MTTVNRMRRPTEGELQTQRSAEMARKAAEQATTAGAFAAASHTHAESEVTGLVTDLAGKQAILSASGALWTPFVASEALTLTGLVTDTVASLLPANSVIDGIGWRILTTISGTTLTAMAIGDPTTVNRFASGVGIFTASTTGAALDDWSGAVATLAAGPTQAAAAKVRVTLTAVAFAAGAIRLVVFGRTLTPPTS